MNGNSENPLVEKKGVQFQEFPSKTTVVKKVRELHARRSMTVINMMMGGGCHAIDESKLTYKEGHFPID